MTEKLIGGQIDLDSQLHEVVTGDPTVKAIAREKRKLKEKLNEKLYFQRVDDEGNIVTTWQVQRRKCNRNYLQIIVNQSPLPCEIDYVYDNANTVLQIDELVMKGQKGPDVFYIFVPRIFRKPRDDLEDLRYFGQTMFMIRNVPLKALNGEIVESMAIHAWLMAGIADIDPKSEVIREDIEKIKEELKAVEKKIKSVPGYIPRDKKGELLPDDLANQERQNLLDFHNNEKINVQNKLKSREEDLIDQIERRKLMNLDIFCADKDEYKNTATWHILFKSIDGISDDAEEIEHRLAAKTDWHEIKLCLGEQNDEFPPWVGRGRIPDGSLLEEYNYKQSEVPIHEAHVDRLAHGMGTYKQLDGHTKTNLKGDRFLFYHGDWDTGRRNGHGISIDDSGVYSGRHVDDRRRGQGTLDLPNGVTIIGNFNSNLQHYCHVEGELENPYLEGEPTGEVEIRFSDGALFKGCMENGRINGPGEYQSGFGEIMKGEFSDGILNGSDCYVKNCYDEEYRGRFADGDIDGYGQYRNHHNYSYLGYWKHGMKYGKGVESGHTSHLYRGYFVNDYRCGKGEIQFHRKKKQTTGPEDDVNGDKDVQENQESSAKKESKNDRNHNSATCHGDERKSETESMEKRLKDTVTVEVTQEQKLAPDPLANFLLAYQGIFLANRPSVCGALVNTENHTIRCISKLDPTLEPINRLNSKYDKRRIRAKRKLVKFQEMEHFIRSEMERKKWKMYRQQRHFTKKTMSFEERYGLDMSEIQSLFELRQDRLDKMNMDMHRPERALVSRIGDQVNREPITKLQQSFEKLQLDQDQRFYGDNDIMARVAVSNFDEFVERQRFIKYDRLWERAEKAYSDRKKGIAALSKLG